MKTTDIRVRPVIRHAVTRFTQDGRSAGSEMIGEFANEAYAEEVAQVLTEKACRREYVIVEQTMGELTARVTFAYSEEEANSQLASEEAVTGKTFRVFSRPLDWYPR